LRTNQIKQSVARDFWSFDQSVLASKFIFQEIQFKTKNYDVNLGILAFAVHFIMS
jgi:hypothetical protein